MNKDEGSSGIERRSFFGSLGAGVIGAKAVATAAPPPEQPGENAAPVKLNLVVNGRRHGLMVEPRTTLQFVLRERLGLTGTKVSCERGECGACTVLVDGIPRYSCMTLAVEVAGREITTVEGIMQGEQLGPVQQAFVAEDGMQCGFCTPGQVMAAEGLLRQKPAPNTEEIREAMSGNLCRCGTYNNILKAVHRAADLRKSGGAA